MLASVDTQSKQTPVSVFFFCCAMRLSDPATWHFDIDQYLNPIIPPPPWRWLPYPIAFFLGYRKQPPKAVGNLIIIFWAFVGIFVGLLVVEAVSTHIPVFEHRHGPIVVASFVCHMPLSSFRRKFLTSLEL